jgi:Flp pilus assembly secretin CpaC
MMSKKINQRIKDGSKNGGYPLPGLLCFCAVVFISGCGDFFAVRPTELESKVVLDELSQVKESPFIGNPLPDVYRQPPTRVSVSGGVKLFYFTKNLPVQQVAALTTQQLGLKIAQNVSTNQLVIYCADDAGADQVLQYLEIVDVAPVQVNVDCLILERFGDVTMDWETTLLAENLLGESITVSEGKDVTFPGASLREPDRKKFGLDIGYIINRDQPGHRVKMLVDLLVSRGYLKVLLNPQIETVNGQKATVSIKDYAPIEKLAYGAGGGSDAYNITTYVWVANTLTVTPYVYADGSVGLTTDIKIGSRSKPEGVVQRSIITERSINVEENRVKPGNSLIIGGMRKSEKRDVIRGVPFLKDLPVVGILFSSRDFEEKGTEIIFILTPSISSGSRDHKQVVGEIRTRYADPDVKEGMSDILKDPMGTNVYASIVEKEAVQAEMDRVNAELLRQQAANKAAAEKQFAGDAAAEATRLRKEAERLTAQAEKELADAQNAAEQAKSAQAAKETEVARLAELEIQKQKAQEDAQKAQGAALQAQNAATEAAQKAVQQEARAKQALQDAQKAQESARQAAETAAEKARVAEQERKVREEAARKAKAEAEEKARLEAERKAKEQAEQKAKAEAEEKARQEAAAAVQAQPAPDPNKAMPADPNKPPQ